MSRVRVDRLMRWYPKRWRRRYGDEFSALVEDLISSSSFDKRVQRDFVLGGLRLRARSIVQGSRGVAGSILQNVVILAFCGALVFIAMTALSNRVAPQWRNGVSLEVFMAPSASPRQVAAVNNALKRNAVVSHCNYLDHQASYGQARRTLADEPTTFNVLTPSTTPTVFRCQLRDLSKAPVVASKFIPGANGVLSSSYSEIYSGTLWVFPSLIMTFAALLAAGVLLQPYLFRSNRSMSFQVSRRKYNAL